MSRWALVAIGLLLGPILSGCGQGAMTGPAAMTAPSPGVRSAPAPDLRAGSRPPAHAEDVGDLVAWPASGACLSVSRCERMAERGDAAAQFQLGAWRYLGTELPRDERIALRHFREAAAGGEARAQHVLGLIYMTGDIVPPDRAEAGRWLTAAAEAGFAPSREMLAHFGFAQAPPGSPASTQAGPAQAGPTRRAAEAPPPPPPPAPATARSVALGDPPLDPVSLYEKVEPSVWTVMAAERYGNGIARRSGSAVAVSERWLFTNCHVVSGADFILIKRRERVEPARLVRANDATDRCVLETQARLSPVDRIAPYHALKVGQSVYTVGSPAGLENTFGPGMVTGLREWQGVPIIQTNAPISPGSSGGALFDAQGDLVGITTFTMGSDGALGFAVAADSYIRAMLPDARG